MGKIVPLRKIMFAAACFLVACSSMQARAATISIVTDGKPAAAVRHGLNKVKLALGSKGVSVTDTTTLEEGKGNRLIVAGLGEGSGAAAQLIEQFHLPAPEDAEALLIRRLEYEGKPVLLICGADDRGLMYALLDVADRIDWAADPGDPLSEVRDATEQPAVVERALSKYAMNRSYFESTFYDEDYWVRFLDTLARNRFNTFALLFAYEANGYFAPPYPYFFDTEGFPEVRVVGLSKEDQQRNLAMLNRIVQMTHDRGMNFTLGIWDHIYRGGVQGSNEFARNPTPGLAWGVTTENLIAYTKAALANFIHLVPDIDAIQFRMHGESGLKRSEMETFWENIYQVMKKSGAGIRFDARAKNFPDSLIDMALDMGLDMRICTKYWMEQMGLPFHPTHINPANQHDRRHGYADLLRYPRKYKMHWRLWNGGASRILLWGDPEYVRRFAASTHLYNGEGFEVNEPLATKMQDHPHDMEPFELLAPQNKYYDWEFERYWHFFQVFGRLGYNPDTPPEVWHKEFERRFGKDAAPFVERGLHHASRILPRIVAYTYPYRLFPTTRGWIEKQRMEDLPVYAKALPSDTQQFLSIDEAARLRLEGGESAKIGPLQSSAWFARAARDVLKLAEEAEARIGDRRNKEFDSTMVDLKILAHLASYHSWRARAGVDWALFQRCHDLNALDDAIENESRAIEAWERLVDAAGDVYHFDLMMGRRKAGLSGHWRDELKELKTGLRELRKERTDFTPASSGEEPKIAHAPIRKTPPGKELVLRATVSGLNTISRVQVSYGAKGNDGSQVVMERIGPMRYRAVIPAADVTEGLHYFMEAIDSTNHRTSYPDAGKEHPILVAVTGDHEPPAVEHEPISSAAPGKPLTITVKARDPSGIKWVRLRYRGVTQFEDYRMLPMLPMDNDRFQAVVPGEHIASKYDFMYLIETMDRQGNGAIYPDLEVETPYIVVELDRGDEELTP